jgi:hypothetical protein
MKKRILILSLLILFFSATAILAQEAPYKLKVVAEQANIRLKPDIGSIIIKQVPQGTILNSSGKQGEWYQIIIETDEKERASGYVHESLVVVISPLPPKEKEKAQKLKEVTSKDEPTEIKVYPTISPPSPPSKHRFDLSLSGGAGFINGGDLNTGTQGLADFYRDALSLEGSGEVRSVRLSYVFGGELSFSLFSDISVGLGADFLQGEKKSQVDFRMNDTTTQSFITQPKIQALPLRLFLTFSPFSSFYIKTGVEYYFAECVYLYRLERGELWEEHQGEAKAQDFGFLGGFGFEWEISPPLSFVIEALGRYARITGFEGKNTYRDSESSLSTEEGKLYFYQGVAGIDATYPLLFIRKNEPAGSDIAEVREAVVDFSGLSLKVGIRIRF